MVGNDGAVDGNVGMTVTEMGVRTVVVGDTADTLGAVLVSLIGSGDELLVGAVAEGWAVVVMPVEGSVGMSA